MRGGMSHADALRAARVEMGQRGIGEHKGSASGWESAAEFLWQDIRYGMRQLLRNPGFSAVALAHTGAGDWRQHRHLHAGACGDAEQLPIAHPQALYRVGEGEYYCCEWGGLEGSWGTFDYPFYKHLRRYQFFFEQIAAFSGNTPSLTRSPCKFCGGSAGHKREYVSGNYFSTLGCSLR